MLRLFKSVVLIVGLACSIQILATETDSYGFGRSSTNVGEEYSPKQRRAAVGAMAGGISGIFGLKFELGFTPTTAFDAGFGTSTDYQSLFLGLRHHLMSSWISPYVSGGYARWYASGKERSVGKTTPAFVGERFLNDEERQKGRFSENILYAALGLQVTQLSGDWAGAAIYLEGLLLADLDDLVSEGTMGLGALYYF